MDWEEVLLCALIKSIQAIDLLFDCGALPQLTL